MKFKAYLRVSTDQQAESGLGMEAQRVACEGYAKKFGQEIVKFYTDDGFSAALPIHKRPALVQAIAEIETGDVLLVAKRDRLGRDVLVTAMLDKEMGKKGAKIVSVAGEGTHDDDPSSLLMRRIVDSFGEYERHLIKARTRAALAVKKRRNERVGYIPYGYKLAENGLNLVENEEEKKIIIGILYLRKMGYTFRRIAEELNFEGKLNRKQGEWNHVSVFNIITKWNLQEPGLV